MRDADDATRFGLFSMWVAPEARRRGVGRALVDDVIAFYETCAFVDDGRREPLVHTPTVIEVGMTRLLSPTRTVARRNESSRS